MEEHRENVTPFWVQSTHNRRRPLRLSSFFLSSGLLLFLLCVVAFLFMFFVLPSILSLTAQIFRPNSVKKSWESLNLVLVLFALVLGFLSRNRNYDSRFDEDHRNVAEIKSNPSTPHQWYECSDRTVYSGLRRNSSSYPDLREVSPWVNADERRRFSDDTQLDNRRSSDSDHLRRRRSWKRVSEEDEEGSDHIKTVHVDTLVTRTEHVSYSPTPPQSSPPVTAVHRKPRRTYESVGQVKGPEPTKTLILPAVTLPPPPQVDSEKKSGKSDRKRSGGNATKEFLTSLYHQKKKKKKQRQKSVENFETLIQPQAPISFLPSPSPPPPPPPPPPLFPNLFSSKKGKSKKFLTVPPPPPPPPPPVATVRASKTTAQIAPMASREPPLPVKIRSFSSVEEENSNSGGESPRIPIPPPPPFKMPSWRFVVKGDYVKVGSMNSSHSGSPDHSDGDESPTAAVDSGKAMAPLFCPSPDVNSKADMFIAKFRAGLKLQKMNSIKQKEGLGLSKLGPETKPGPSPSNSEFNY